MDETVDPSVLNGVVLQLKEGDDTGSRLSAVMRTDGFPEELVALLEDPSRAERYRKALWRSNEERSLVLQYVIRRYIWQIRYGCRNQQCRNPHCFSSSRPDPSKPPIRRPTFLTARAMAYVLATRDRPLESLCANPPSIHITDLTVEYNLSLSDVEAFVHEWFRLPSSPSASVGSDQRLEVEMSKFHPLPNAHPNRSRVAGKGPETLHFALYKPAESRLPLGAYIDRISKDRRDRKSLAQNLLGSCSSRIFEVFDPSFTYMPGFTANSTVANKRRLDIGPAHSTESKVLGEGEKKEPEPHPYKIERRTSFPVEGQVALKPRTTSSLEASPKKHEKGSLRRSKQRRKSEHGSQAITEATLAEVIADGEVVESTQITRPSTPPRDPPPELEPIKVEARPSNSPPERGPYEHVPEAQEPSPGQLKPAGRPRLRTTKPKSSKSILRSAPKPIVFTGESLAAVRDGLFKSDYNDFLTLPAQCLDEDKEPYWFAFPSATRKPDTALNTVNHALQASLSSWPTLLKCFREGASPDATLGSPRNCFLSYIDGVEKSGCFFMWSSLNGPLILDALWHPLQALYHPPPALSPQALRNPKLRAHRRGSSVSAPSPKQSSPRPLPSTRASSGRHLSNEEAAHIVMICLQAIFGRCAMIQPWLGSKYFHEGRSRGRTYAADAVKGKSPDMDYLDEIDHEPTRRLFCAIVRALGARRCFDEIARATSRSEAAPTPSNPLADEETVQSRCNVLKLVLEYFVVGKEVLSRVPRRDGALLLDQAPATVMRHVAYVYTLIDLLQSVILFEWDGKPELHRWSPVGAAVDILADIYANRDLYGIPAERFTLRFLADRLDPVSTPISYMSWNRTPNTSHVLAFPFLFPRHTITSYFRTITFSSLTEAYNTATYTRNLFEKWVHDGPENPDGLDAQENRRKYLEYRMNRALTRMLYLDCKRGTILQDAFTQLWGREKRELKRPLKVQLGFGEGEEGLDHGGVSQEFFGVVFGPAFVEDAGLFVTDPRSRMSYFRPLSPAPLRHFELIGVLVGLALYNGCTVPINFPQAVYRKLLGLPVDRLEHIKDGWQDLVSGFEQLLSWNDDPDVSDVFVREYVYSFDGLEGPVEVDMKAFGRDDDWPRVAEDAVRSPSPVIVDNNNRHQYVQDYLFWMIHKSVEPQYKAFSQGFYSVIEKRSVSMLSPEHLAILMAGHTNLTAIGLYRAATYEEGYSRTHPTILNFWDIVMAFDQAQLRQLLEFVTACDRVPVNGIEDVAFCIVRNGVDDDRIPQSMTCYGKLLLPDYSTQEKLKRKLTVALENSLGFGSA